MAGRQPREPPPLAIQVDPRPARVPLHEPAREPEREPAQLVAPHELDGSARGQLEDSRRDRLAAQRVERGEVREVGLGRAGQRTTRIDQIAPMIRNGPYGT